MFKLAPENVYTKQYRNHGWVGEIIRMPQKGK